MLGHRSISKKYEILSNLVGAEALDVQDREDCMPELKAWVAETLAAMFSDLDPFTSEDGSVIVSIATSDTSGFLLRDRNVSPDHVCHVLRLTTSLQCHT